MYAWWKEGKRRRNRERSSEITGTHNTGHADQVKSKIQDATMKGNWKSEEKNCLIIIR
jgi:hypothetical protein